MKKILVYEFNDLLKSVKDTVIEKTINDCIDCRINRLSNDLENKMINEKTFYEILGCSKSYADTTAWFIPSCYYDKNKKEVDKEIKEIVNEGLYTVRGHYIQQKSADISETIDDRLKQVDK